MTDTPRRPSPQKPQAKTPQKPASGARPAKRPVKPRRKAPSLPAFLSLSFLSSLPSRLNLSSLSSFARGMDTRTALAVAGIILVICFGASFLMEGGGSRRSYVTPVETGAPKPDDPGDVAGFRRDCVEGVLKKNADVPASCRTAAAIRAAYRVDALDQLGQAHGRMVMTTRRIMRGDILDDAALGACIRQGGCVPIPLPPLRDRTKKTADLSPESRRARLDFWRLANGDPLGPEICAYMDVCRALYKSGIVTFPPQERN